MKTESKKEKKKRKGSFQAGHGVRQYLVGQIIKIHSFLQFGI